MTTTRQAPQSRGPIPVLRPPQEPRTRRRHLTPTPWPPCRTYSGTLTLTGTRGKCHQRSYVSSLPCLRDGMRSKETAWESLEGCHPQQEFLRLRRNPIREDNLHRPLLTQPRTSLLLNRIPYSARLPPATSSPIKMRSPTFTALTGSTSTSC